MPELIGSFFWLESDCLTLPPSGRLAGCGIAANPSGRMLPIIQFSHILYFSNAVFLVFMPYFEIKMLSLRCKI